MTKDDALARHVAILERARGVIAAHDGIRHELAEALALKAEADRAADANLAAALSGTDTSETQEEFDAALQALIEFDGGRWLTLFWFLTSPLEDITHETTH